MQAGVIKDICLQAVFRFLLFYTIPNHKLLPKISEHFFHQTHIFNCNLWLKRRSGLLQDKIPYPATAHYILIYWLFILLSNIYIRYVPLISFPFCILSFSFIALEKSYQIGKKAPCQRFNYMIRYTASVFAGGQYISYNYLTAFLYLSSFHIFLCHICFLSLPDTAYIASYLTLFCVLRSEFSREGASAVRSFSAIASERSITALAFFRSFRSAVMLSVNESLCLSKSGSSDSSLQCAILEYTRDRSLNCFVIAAFVSSINRSSCSEVSISFLHRSRTCAE